MAKVDLFDWTDVLSHGTKEFDYGWNQLHDILVKDEFCPMYEIRSKDYHISEFEGNDYGYSEDTCKVALSFMKAHNIKEMTIV